jgi:hypothetical protein
LQEKIAGKNYRAMPFSLKRLRPKTKTQDQDPKPKTQDPRPWGSAPNPAGDSSPDPLSRAESTALLLRSSLRARRL